MLVEWDNFAYVVDCGPDFRQQMLNCGCTKIDGILLTHEHADHTAGLDDIRPFNYRQGPLPLFAHKRVFEQLELRFAYIFETVNRYPGAPAVIKNTIKNNVPFRLGNLEVIPVNGMHYSMQVFGFRFYDFAYLTDMKTVEPEEIDKIKNIKVLVINALREEPHTSHFNLEEALEFIKKVNPERAYLTHISHLLGFHDAVQQHLPENVFLAYDQLQITI